MRPVTGDILVLGLGASGFAAASYLGAAACRDRGVRVTAIDQVAGADEQGEVLRRLGVDVRRGVTELPPGDWDLIVASPGIPPHNPLMQAAFALGVPVISEIELAFGESESPFAAVTGTNGKTTVTSLLTHILVESGMPAEAVGNIGPAAITAVSQVGRETLLVTEVSSFQLALTVDFSPRVAVLLNITPDHVDWHGTLEDYAAAKAKVFANQGRDDVAVIDMDDSGSAPYADIVASRGVRVVRVSRNTLHPGGASVVGGILTLDTADGPVGLIAVADLPILGQHNVSNALAAAAAAAALGAPIAGIRAGLRSFLPIEHRLEPVDVIRGVEYFNDSKATNPDAVKKALTAFDDRPVIVLLGGHNKGNDFHALAADVAASCRAAILFGESRDELAAAFRGLDVASPVRETMMEAVCAAAEMAEEGDVVLLSPANASFDEFTSYEHRGRVFKSAVAALAAEAKEAGR